MAVNQKPAPQRAGVRFEAHWRTISWAVLDKGLQLVYGLVFLLLVLRGLPREEYGLQGLATALQLTISQLVRSLLLVPLIKHVAEEAGPGRVASTGALLHVTACSILALLLGAGSGHWAGLFAKPDLAAVLVPTAFLLAAMSPRDAAISNLEGQRRLRSVFWLDLTYFALAAIGLLAWRHGPWPRTAAAVQWAQACAAAAGTLVALLVTRRDLLRAPCRHEARRLWRFGVASLGSGLGATLAQQGDMLLAGRLMDARGVGAYNAAKLLFRVFNALAQAVNQVVMPAASRLDTARRQDDLRVLFEKGVCFLALALVPLCIGLILLAGPLLDLLFAGHYADSVRPLQLLVASALTMPLATIGSSFLTGLGRLRTLMWMTWAGVAIALGLTLLWVPAHGPNGAAGAYLVAAVFGMLARGEVLRRRLGFRYADIAARTRDAADFARRRLGRAH